MTFSQLAAAIMAVRPETPQHLAIAIATNSLAYSRAFDVAPELIAARILSRNGREAAHEIPFLTWLIAGEAAGFHGRYAKPLMAQAAKLRALAETFPAQRYGAE